MHRAGPSGDSLKKSAQLQWFVADFAVEPAPRSGIASFAGQQGAFHLKGR
jgi:hypothetical protein